MSNCTGGYKRTAAEDLARVLEAAPFASRSLKLDHPTLVTRLEALVPFIGTFVSAASRLYETGKVEESRMMTQALVKHLAASLDISVEESQSFCVYILMMRAMVTCMRPVFESLAEKRAWEEHFERLWERN